MVIKRDMTREEAESMIQDDLSGLTDFTMETRTTGKRMNKYRNKKTVVDGITFDSKKESHRFSELRIMQMGGYISGLILQPTFEIIPQIKWNGKTLRKRLYIADFLYKQNGITIVEDVKGFRTQVYKLKRQLFLIRYPEYWFKET